MQPGSGEKAPSPRMGYIEDKELFKAVMYALRMVYEKRSAKEAVAMSQKKHGVAAEKIMLELGTNFHLYPHLMQKMGEEKQEYLKKVGSSPMTYASASGAEEEAPSRSSMSSYGDGNDVPF